MQKTQAGSTQPMTMPELARHLVTLRNTLLGASLLLVLISWRFSAVLFVAAALVSGVAWLMAEAPASSVECRR